MHWLKYNCILIMNDQCKSYWPLCKNLVLMVLSSNEGSGEWKDMSRFTKAFPAGIPAVLIYIMTQLKNYTVN